MELSVFQQGIEAAMLKHKGRPRHCAVNAIRSLRRAWLIADVDPEMALFRAITAEEEAATALIAALQRRRYPAASKLDGKRHADKVGWMVFIHMLGGIFAASGWPKPMLRLQKEARPPRIDVHIPSAGLGMEAGYHVTPDEPLNLTMHETEIGRASRRMTFAEQLADLARERNARSIIDHIRAEANLRNVLLYASDGGITVVTNPDGFILERMSRVFVLLGLTIIILQTPKHQLLAKQALEAYLATLHIRHDETFDYTVPGVPPDLLVEIHKEGDKAPEVTLRRRSDLRAFDSSTDFIWRGGRTDALVAEVASQGSVEPPFA